MLKMMTTSFYDKYKIRGLDFFNFATCKTRFWLQHKNIAGNFSENEHVQTGKILDSYSFQRNKRELIIDGVCQIDFISQHDKLEIHEIKKGKEISEPQILQVQYYMKILKELTEQEVLAYIHLVQVKKKIQVEYNEDILDRAIEEMLYLLDKKCPEPKRIPVCKGCSYAEMCWA